MANELEFVRLTDVGMTVDDISTIRTKIINRYKSIYGPDIDLTDGTADGMFINLMSQLVWNSCLAVYNLYNELSIDTASGDMLTNLCNLSNVIRHGFSSSRATVELVNTTLADITRTDLQLIDVRGTTWTVPGTITIPHEGSITVVAVCDVPGPIHADPGDIYQTIEALNVTVNQNLPAELGTDPETDEELKARKASANGSTGSTVIESMVSALLDLEGVKMAAAITNNTDSNQTMEDGTVVGPGAIYVMVRSNNEATLDSLIAQTIFDKLTPGIKTTACTANYDCVPKSVTCYDNMITAQSISTVVNWKECTGGSGTVNLEIAPDMHFVVDTVWTVARALNSFINGRYLNQSIDASELMTIAYNADPTYYGKRTFAVVSSNAVSSHNNYFNNANISAIMCDGEVNSIAFSEGMLNFGSTDYTAVPTGAGENFKFMDEYDNVAQVVNGRLTGNETAGPDPYGPFDFPITCTKYRITVS